MVNVTTIILIFMMLEPQNCRPPVRETEYQPSEYQLSENVNSAKMRTQ